MLAVVFVKGLQGNDPHYWQTASLMKHFLASDGCEEKYRIASRG
jgi:hypothetical protein